MRATSPGAEFRDAKRLAALRREKEEKLKQALHSSLTTKSAGPDTGAEDDDPATATTTTSSGGASPASSASPGMRRFQISRTRSILRGTAAGAGVQKRKGFGAVAVLVEKLRRKPHSRQASMVTDAAVRAEDVQKASDVASTTNTDSRDTSVPLEDAVTAAARPRKRPVINKAERAWREKGKRAADAAKRNISQALEKEAQTQYQSTWDDESERLAREFEQIALEMEGTMEEDTENVMPPPPTQARSAPAMPKPPLKYPPRTPNRSQAGKPAESKQGGEEPAVAPVAATAPSPASRSVEEMEHEEDSDGEYVYDTYIRKPLPEATFGGGTRDKGGHLLTNPLVDWQQDQDAWLRQKGIDTTRADIGVIIITQEDEEYWEHFVEDDDEDRWDSEDGDSNGKCGNWMMLARNRKPEKQKKINRSINKQRTKRS